MSERIFLFIDETGDLGHYGKRDSSAYFQTNIISTNKEGLRLLTKHFSRFRYFTDSQKELKKYYHANARSVLLDLFRECSTAVHFYSFYLEKKIYIPAYPKNIGKSDAEYDAKKFRNFILKKSLQLWFKEEYSMKENQHGDVELVIDRFLDNEDEETELKRYLRGGYSLPLFFHITQVDSDYSDPIQIADLLGKIVKEKIFLGKTINLKYISIHEMGV